MRAQLPDPATAPELFDGVLTRRVMAFVIDCVLMGMIALVLTVAGFVGGFFTFGLGWVSIPIAVPLAIALYYVVTLGSRSRATLGMRAMDLVLTPTRGTPLDGWAVLLHPIVFWITVWISWPVSLAFALFTPRRQMVHDLVAGTLMVRHSPMKRHWLTVGAS